MRVDIRGKNPVTSDQVKSVIDDINNEYAKTGLVIKSLTCYMRMQDENGEIVEPKTIDGKDIFKHTYTFTKTRPTQGKNMLNEPSKTENNTKEKKATKTFFKSDGTPAENPYQTDELDADKKE